MIHYLPLNNDPIKRIDIHDPVYKTTIPLTKDDVAPAHKWNFDQRGMNFNKDLGFKGKYCYHPFNTITVDSDGDVYVCVCQAWLPISVGKIWDFDRLEDTVRGPVAREIQASIIDGTYRYCDQNSCGIIQTDLLETKIAHRSDSVNWINFAIDPSCNLTCPSCRTEFKFLSEGPEFDKRIRIVDHMVRLIENHDQFIKFTLSGDGDPFASLIYRNLLTKLNLENNTQTEIEIVTNGQLIKAFWDKMQGIHKNVVRFKISFDAASESVYNKTRRGGDWNKLIENSKYIVSWRKATGIDMTLCANFVVQTANYRDMLNYVRLCDSLGFDEIMFQKIVDWSTFDKFDDHAIWKNTHPEHQKFLKILHDPLLENKKVCLTNLGYIKNDSIKPSKE